MSKRKIGQAFIWLALAWLIATPLFWQFDLSKGQSGFYDAFGMAPLGILHLLVFYGLIFLGISLQGVSFGALLLLSLYFPFIQLVNYPYLTYRDVYVHAAPVETILANGTLSYTRDPTPASWPASFDLHGTSSIVLGLDLVTANYVLYFAMVVVLALTSYVFAKRMEKNGYRLAVYSAVLFQCLFANYLFDFNHFSRATFEFVYLFLFFFSFIFFKGRRGYLLQILFTVATAITHPFASFALMLFATSFFVLTSGFTERFLRRGKRPTLPTKIARAVITEKIIFPLFAVVTFTAWFVFAGFQRFQEAIGIMQTFLSPRYVSAVSQTFQTKAALPFWGSLLRELFRYSQLLLLGIACILVVYVVYARLRYREVDGILVGVASLVPMALIILLLFLLLPDWGISRASAFSAFPAAFSSLVIADLFVGKRKLGRIAHFILRKKKVFLVFLLSGIMTLSAAVMVLRFERNYYFGEITHKTELSALSFFFSVDSNSPIAIVSWRTWVYSAYFNYEGSHATLGIWYKDLEKMKGNSSDLLQHESGLINQSQAVIRGMRDEFDFASFDSPTIILDNITDFFLPEFSQIYSNGYFSIFKHPLTLTVNVIGNGSVIKFPDQASYTYGDNVTLTATHDYGWKFDKWSVDAFGNNTTTFVNMTRNMVVNATFIPEGAHYTLTVKPVGNGVVERDKPGPFYNLSDLVQLTAVPASGWYFAGWSVDVPDMMTNPTVVNMTRDKVIIATFTQNP